MADSPEKKKRKRDVKEGDLVEIKARITYHTPFKTFERVFNEASLDDTKRVVRAKLGLEPSVNVELAHLRGESKIVLEDEDDFHAFCIALLETPRVDVQVTLSDTLHSTTTIQNTEITAPATKKRKTKQSIAPTPTHNVNANGSTSAHDPAAAYATPANSTIHPSIAFSTSSIASVPPSTSPSKSTSPATITSPLLAFPSISAPFTVPMFPTVEPVRNLPPATGVFGPTPKDKKKDKAKDKDGKADTDDEEEEEKQEKEKKEKPKRVRKKSEAAAPAAPMSPAARAKAAAILERHRQAIAERAANPPPRKRAKKADEIKEPSVTVSKAVEETPAVDEDIEDEDTTKKEKRKRKKKKHAEVEQDQEDDEEAAREDSPAKTARKESPESAREESPSREKKGKKKKDKESSSPVRASVASGTIATVEDDGGGVFVDMEDVWGPQKIPAVGDKPKGKSKPAVASKSKLVPVITRPADSSTILNAKKGDKTTVVSPAVPKPLTAQTKKAPSTSSTKQAASVSSAKSPPPSAPKVAEESNATSITSNTSKKPRAVSPHCPICLAPFHLRFKCPLLQDRGPAMFRRLAELERTGQVQLVNDLRKWLDTETKRDQLRALGKQGAIGKNGQGARAGVLSDGDEDEARDRLKKRLMSFESEERDEPEEDEEKEVESDVLGDLNETEEEEDDDEDAREDSVPASLGRPTTSKPSLVSVQKPGEGSETTSSDSDEDEDMEPTVQNGDEDEEMQDASRASTSHNLSAKRADGQETSSSSISSSTRSDSPSPPDKRKANASQNKSAKPPSTARSSHTFRDITHETEGQATDAVHQRMQRDTAKVLVPNSDDSGDEMIEVGENVDTDDEEDVEEEEMEGPHTPNGKASEHRLSMDGLMQRRESPVAKGRTPGTPSRIQVMKDRHGNTAPVQRSYGGEGINGDQFSPPSAHPFPNHKLQSASQPSALSSRTRLSEMTSGSFAGLRNVASNLFKGTLAPSPTAQGLPTPISVPPSGRVPNRDTANDFSDESTSSSSTESDSDPGRGASRVPKRQRARARPPKKSMLKHM